MEEMLTGREHEVDVFMAHNVLVDVAELDEGRTADRIGFMR
jgi:hypothetical protein